MSTPLRIREASEADIPEILDLLRAALGETPLLRRTPAMFSWKHLENPFGPSIVLLAEIGGRIAGLRALMRWSLITPAGYTIKCVRAVDTATHPEFHRRGVFRTLTLNALDVARADGVQLVFNTPNSKSANGYFKMGWREVGWIGAMVRPKFGRAVPAGSDLPEIAASVPGAEPLPEIVGTDRAALGLRTTRTAKYLAWRYANHPRACYGWVEDDHGGGAVLRASTRNGHSETVVADLLGGASAAALRNTAKMSKSRYIGTWFSKGSPERRAALLAGIFPIPGLKTLRLVTNPLTELDTDVFDLGCWDVAVGDMELL